MSPFACGVLFCRTKVQWFGLQLEVHSLSGLGDYRRSEILAEPGRQVGQVPRSTVELVRGRGCGAVRPVRGQCLCGFVQILSRQEAVSTRQEIRQVTTRKIEGIEIFLSN